MLLPFAGLHFTLFTYSLIYDNNGVGVFKELTESLIVSL